MTGAVQGWRRRAFSMVELIIVVVIVGIIGAIAIPRMGGVAERSAHQSALASQQALQRAIDRYAAEHAGRTPAHNPGGSVTADPRVLVRRLMMLTSETGVVQNDGDFGPYLRAWPANPLNGSRALRIDGVPAPANLAGWRFDTARGEIELDTLVQAARPVVAVPNPADTVTPVTPKGAGAQAPALGGAATPD